MIDGARMQKLRDRAIDWYVHKRQEMIEQLQSGHPYGTVRLSPLAQYQRFQEMTPEDYEALVVMLNEKYRGLPDAIDRVNTDLANFIAHMITLELQRSAV